MNCLRYADWALGQFFENAKRAGYYDDTIFILSADHDRGESALGTPERKRRRRIS